jgi:hypothetical protein
MNEDSIRLLREVNSGCKNATDSFGQVLDFIKEKKLRKVVEKYNEVHVDIGDECHVLLNECGVDEKDPPSMAKAMMWITTEMKMMMDSDDSHIADLLADGCNMGIKSLSKYLRQYPDADIRASRLAGKLIDTELELYKKLLAYM